MKNRQNLIIETTREEHNTLLAQLFAACYMDPLTGKFHCKKCHSVVQIDLSRFYAFCPVHGTLV